LLPSAAPSHVRRESLCHSGVCGFFPKKRPYAPACIYLRLRRGRPVLRGDQAAFTLRGASDPQGRAAPAGVSFIDLHGAKRPDDIDYIAATQRRG